MYFWRIIIFLSMQPTVKNTPTADKLLTLIANRLNVRKEKITPSTRFGTTNDGALTPGTHFFYRAAPHFPKASQTEILKSTASASVVVPDNYGKKWWVEKAMGNYYTFKPAAKQEANDWCIGLGQEEKSQLLMDVGQRMGVTVPQWATDNIHTVWELLRWIESGGTSLDREQKSIYGNNCD